MFEFIEEAFDQVAIFVEERTEGGFALLLRHRRDIRLCALGGDRRAQIIGIISTVGEQYIIRAQTIQHFERAMAIIGLPRTQSECDR